MRIDLNDANLALDIDSTDYSATISLHSWGGFGKFTTMSCFRVADPTALRQIAEELLNTAQAIELRREAELERAPYEVTSLQVDGLPNSVGLISGDA